MSETQERRTRTRDDEEENTEKKIKEVVNKVATEMKKARLSIMGEPNPSDAVAVEAMRTVITKVSNAEQDRFILFLAHSPATAMRIFRFLYERTTLRIYIETTGNNNEDEDEDKSDCGEPAYFDSVFSWVKHRIVVTTPSTLRKKIEVQGQGLITQISLVVLCDAYRIQPLWEKENKDSSSSSSSPSSPSSEDGEHLVPLISVLECLGDMEQNEPSFLDLREEEDKKKEENIVKLMWEAGKKGTHFTLDKLTDESCPMRIYPKGTTHPLRSVASFSSPSGSENGLNKNRKVTSLEPSRSEEGSVTVINSEEAALVTPQVPQSHQPQTSPSSPQGPDPKGELQKYCQRYFNGEFPVYEGNKVTLPDGRVFETKTFGSKKEVEKAVALVALKALNIDVSTFQPPQQQNIQPQPQTSPSSPQGSNPKGDLQEYCQRYFNGNFPVYEGNKVTLPDGRVFETKRFGSKKEVEKAVALVALNVVMQSKTEKSKTPDEGTLNTENEPIPEKVETLIPATTKSQNIK